MGNISLLAFLALIATALGVIPGDLLFIQQHNPHYLSAGSKYCFVLTSCAMIQGRAEEVPRL